PTNDGRWVDTDRQALGYTPINEKHWVFANTGLPPGKSFGESDHLVGYECDGQPPRRPSGYPPFELLAQSSTLDGTWQDGKNEGKAAIVCYDPTPAASDRRGVVFNCGTTDWTRVLMDSSA